MAVYTVDRRTWYRGQGRRNSRLLLANGMRCCIGFVGRDCGIADEAMLNQHGAHCAISPELWPEWFHAGQPLYFMGDLLAAYGINDDKNISDQFRENQLTELFAKHGDTLVFEN